MEASPHLSVAMCTFNGEAYLREQLASIACQSILPEELVVCDDGSADGTIAILEDFRTTAPFPVRIHVNGQNLGVARNFFQAVRLCRSEWVTLCDQDDIWLPDRIQVMISALGRCPDACLIQTNGLLVGRGLERRRMNLFAAYHLAAGEICAINRGEAYKPLSRHVFATGAGMLVSRPWLESVPEPAAGFLHDEWLAWFAGSRLRILDRITFQYRQHERQVTGVTPSLRKKAANLLNGGSSKRQDIRSGVARYQALAEIYAGWPMHDTSQIRQALAGKIAFLECRRRLAGSRLPGRLSGIVYQIATGSYSRYGSGFRTAVKDLIGKQQL